jgi:fumarylacetoacetase
MLRPDNPLLPNYKWVPIGYHGRASSLVVSGTPVARPQGQTSPADGGEPRFGPSRSLDYELEVGAFLGPGNALGQPVPLAQAEGQLFGLCLLNDWSARDLQKWEYQPLGPFLAKSFATSISPVGRDARRARAVPGCGLRAARRGPAAAAVPPRRGGPRPRRCGPAARGAAVERRDARARPAAAVPEPQQPARRLLDLRADGAHHSSNGCNLRPGDLIASGTVSGPAKENRGSLIELAWRGTEPVALPSGEQRRFLETGDEVILRGHCRREGYARIGFGECRGVVA